MNTERVNLKKNEIDVILTTYKRPEVLKQQIDAVRSQTIKPKRLFLYQDGIDSYYKIELKQEILDEFEDYVLSEKNCGVWERFKYAANIKDISEYVCFFDDDTIPGKCWFENCIAHMQKEPAIYGTNGILLKNAEDYPNTRNMIQVGWHNPYDKPIEVDFVGHSWFIKSEWLQGMLSTPYVNEYKYVGEDMCLSFACKQKGIKTVVPPHPQGNLEMWGSIPKYGEAYGVSKVAVSANPTNHSAMGTTLKRMHEDGWHLIYEENKEYIIWVEEELQKYAEGKKDIIVREIEELILESNLPVYLYGAGNYGKIFLEYLNRKNVTPCAFVISEWNYSSKEMNIQGIPVISREELLRRKERKVIILSLNPMFHKEIREKLSEKDIIYPNEELGNCFEEILNYLK